MLYNHNGETFKLDNTSSNVKLYHKAVNRWSSGWTYVGNFKTLEKAQAAARLYAR
jgi:hypothetical protein